MLFIVEYIAMTQWGIMVNQHVNFYEYLWDIFWGTRGAISEETKDEKTTHFQLGKRRVPELRSGAFISC
jgi:hypothetical protein